MLVKCKCPVCNGTGEIEPPGLEKKQLQKITAIKKLKADGYSYRDIMRLMGFKSVSVVSYYLNIEKPLY